MVRPAPSEWEVLDLSDDPTPGNPEVLRQLARRYHGIADDAESAFSVINQVDNESLGEGKSMDKLRETLDELPGQVGQLRDSYRRAAEALEAYAPKLEIRQEQADRALADGKEARSSLDLALAALDAAGAHLSTLENAAPPPPDDTEARNAARDAVISARATRDAAQGDVDASQARLNAAKRLAFDAKELHESDATTASNELDDAKDDAVKKKSWWDSLWDEIINLAIGIVGLVVAVVCLVVPGAFWIGIGVGLVLGFAGVGMGVAKGIQTGEWDIAGIVLSALGAVASGVMAVSRVAQIPGIGNSLRNAGNVAKNVFKPSKPPANPGISLRDLPPVIRPRSVSSGGSGGSGTGGNPLDDIEIPSSSLGDIPHVNPRTPPPTPTPTRPPSQVGSPPESPPESPTVPPTPPPSTASTVRPSTEPVTWLNGPLPRITEKTAEYIGVLLAAGGVGYAGYQLSEAVKRREKQGQAHT